MVGAALLWTLEKGLGDGWTPQVAEAWTAAYGTLSGYMISEAYGQPRPPSKDTVVSEPLVVVGNGMAAARLVDELAKVALGRYAIAVIGDEPRLAYNRVLLSSVLAGETASHDIELKPASWWRDRGVTLKYGCAATEIDVGRRELKIANEESIAFSRLVLATGSTPLRLNVPGAELCRRAYLSRQPRCRSAADARRAEEARRRGRRRIAGAGSRLRSRQGRRTGDADSSDGPADGASARCAGGENC